MLSLDEAWQYAVLLGAAVALLLRRPVVFTIVGAGGVGALAVSLLGASVPH